MLKSDRGNLRIVHLAVRWVMFVLVFVFQLAPAALQANPSGGEVVAGQAQINNSGNTTTINQASQKAIINWQDFSIGSGEVTKFIQPNANAAVLNKVIGNNVSQIYGTLEANGKVFLVNQSGVFVGAGGVINTAGFVASTLDLDTDTFMKGGDLKFSGNSQASVVNLGNINGTSGVFLISQKIENAGKITSTNGEVGLAAGSEVLLRQSGDERTSVLVGSSADGTGISNKGEIAAAVATMKATGSMYSVAVNNEGVVRAQGVNMSGGKVRLTGAGGTVINSGTLSAKTSNEKGGTVIVEGKNVGLIGNAVVDVSGKKGGGTALIGGDWQGSNPDVINSQQTFVGSGVQIKADALESGNGGKVVVWGDDATRFYGDISAKGGANSGNGGNVEVSGKNYLDFNGTVNTTAANGQIGTLLLDPTDIYIAASQVAATGAGMVGTDTTVDASGPANFTASGVVGDSLLLTATLQNALLTNDVIVSTTNASGTGDGDIFIVSDIFGPAVAGRTLTLLAERDITMLVGTQIQGAIGFGLNLVFNADSDATGGGAVALNGTILTSGGNVTIGGGANPLTTAAISRIDGGAGVTLNGLIDVAGGNISIQGQGFNGTDNNVGVLLGTTGRLLTTGTGSITITGTGAGSGNTNQGFRSNSAAVDAILVQNGDLIITGSGSSTSTGNGNSGVLTTTPGNLTSSGSGNITITGNRGAGADANYDVDFASAINSSGSGNILIQSGAGTNVTTGVNNSGVYLNANSSVQSSGTGTVTITGTGGAGTSDNHGVYSNAVAPVVSSVSGDIAITGTGTSGSGIFLFGPSIQSTGTAVINVTGTSSLSTGVVMSGPNSINASTGTGAINITGTTLAAFGDGVLLNNAQIFGNSAAVTVTGIASGGGINMTGGSSITNSSGDINLIGDFMNLAAAGPSTTTGRVTFRQNTNGRDIFLGVGDSATNLGLESAELNNFTGSVLKVGNANTGDIAISGTTNVTGVTTVLSLETAGTNTITDTADLTVNTLVLRGGTGDITLDFGHNVQNLSALSTGNLAFASGAVVTDINSADAVTGINIGANNLVLTSTAAGTTGWTQTNGMTAATLTASTTAANADIIFNNNTSNFITGEIQITTVGATGNATIFNNSATGLLLGTTTIGGNFIASSRATGGAISQSVGEALTVGGTSAFSTLLNDQSITIDTATNALTGAIAVNTAGTTGNVILVNNATGGTTLAASTVNGSLNVTQLDQAGAAITQTGALTVTGQATFTNETTDRGNVSVVNDNAGGTVFGAADSTVGGNLTITSAGPVTQTGAIRVNGNFSSNGAGTTNLDSQNNIISGTFTASDGSIFYREIGVVNIDTDISGIINTGTGSLTIISLEDGQNFSSASIGGSAIALNTAGNSFGGGLVVNSGGTANTLVNVTGQPAGINQNAATLTVGGTASFRAIDGSDGGTTVGAININGTNSLTGAISFTGQNATLVNSTATNLAASVLSGNLSVTSTGNITNTGALTVAGTSNFVGTTAGNTITVNNAGNLLTGAVSFAKTGGGNVILNNNQATVLGDVTTGGGNVTVTSNGSITQSGVTDITMTGGQLNLTTTAGDIVLTTQTNDIDNLGNITAFNNLQYYDADGYNVVGTIASTGFTELGTVSGNVAQTAGSITSNGLLANLLGTGVVSNFSFDQAANNVGTLASNVAVGSSDMNLRFSSGTDFQTGTVNGTAGITSSGGSIRLDAQSGADITFTDNVVAGIGSIVATAAAGGNLIQNGGLLRTNDGNIYLSADAIGSTAAPILMRSTTGNSILLSAISNVGGIFIRNQTQGDLQIVSFNPAGFLDPSNTVANVTGLSSATNLILENDATAANGGAITIAAGATITAAGNVTIDHTDALTQLGAVTAVVVGGTLTLTGNGSIGIGGGGQAIETNAATVAFNKGDGDTALEVTGAVNVSGTLGNGADLFFQSNAGDITILNAGLAAATSGSIFDIRAASGNIESQTGTAFINMAGGDLMLRGSQIGASGVNLQIRNVDRVAASATAGQLNIDHGYTAPSTNATVFIGSVTGFSGTTLNGLNASTNITFNQVAENRIQIENTAAAFDVFSSTGNIDIVVATSASGPDQLLIDSGVEIRSAAGTGGDIFIFGGVNNQGTVSSGTAITLDGGRPDLVLGGVQNYNGSVTFSATQDIVVDGTINQNSASAVTSFVADSDNDGAGGFILTDRNGAGFIISIGGNAASNVSIEGSELVGTYLGNGGLTYTGGTDRGVVIANASGSSAIEMGNLGQVTMVSKDPLTTAQNSIIIDGGITIGSGASANLSLQSDFGIAMSRNMTVGASGTAAIQNEGVFIRTAANARLSVGDAITFTGLGDIGTDGVVPAALLGLTSQGDLQTAAGLMIFDPTKAGSDAFISELNGVAIEGSLALLDLTAGGTISDTTNLLDITVARMTATAGNIELDTGHNISEFNGVTALLGGFTYLGLEDLILSDIVQVSATGSGVIDINVDGFNLNQQAGSIIAGNDVTLTMSTGQLNAFIRDVVASTAQNNSVTIETTGGPGVVVTTSGATSLISTDDLTVLGSGSIGNNLSDGLYSDADNLIFSKTTGDLFVLEDNTIVGNVAVSMDVTGDIGLTTGGTLNVSTIGNATAAADIDLEGINADNGSNIHLIATNLSNSGNARIRQASGSIVMTGGDLLLVANLGIGTKAAPILTEGTYNLAARNSGDNGGIFILNDGGDVIVSDIDAFTPSSPALTQNFNGVFQASTSNSGANTGLRNIRIQNDGGDIRIGDRIQTTLSNQQVLLVANEPDGQILQEDADGVINMAGGQLYLLADSGIGEVDNAVLTAGSYTLAALSSDDSGGNIGGVYLTNTANAFAATGTITIGSFGETGGGLATISGVTTRSPGADADVRIRNASGANSNIVVDNIVQASVDIGGNTVALIADNGAILQGGVNGRIVSDTDGVNPGEVLLAASQGIGTLANALVVQGHYNLGVRNDTLGFTTGTVTGNINILNNALGPISGFGNITITDVNDVFAGAGINAAILPVVGGLNTADTANSGAIRITNTNLGADAGDIIVAETSVETTGTTTGTAFINLVASDDILIGTTGQTAATAVNTQNGAITLSAANSNDIANDGDANDGIVVVGDVNNVTAIVANGTAGVITMSAITDAFADVTIHSALVQANGTIAGDAIIVSANDDILIGDAAQETLSILQTINGGISLTAVNASVGDNADGILIQASDNALANLIDDVFIQAQGVNGTMSITASANTGILTVNGGDDNGAQAVLTSDQGMTVNADTIVLTAGNGTNALARLDAGTTQTVTSNNTANVATAITISGGAGPGTGANAGFTAGGNQSFTIAQGDLVMNGGAAQNNRALIETTAGTQTVTITGTGDVLLTAGSGQNADARIRALTAATSQTVTVNDGNLTLTAGSDATNGGDASIIYNATAPGLQTVTVSGDTGLGLIQLNGGTGAAANALIDSNTVQTVTAESGLDLNGGLGAGTQSSARIFANDSQTITVLLGDITMDGGTALQNRADIETTNGVQLVQITGAGNLTMTGGPGEEADARIRASNTATSQTVDLADGNLALTAGNNATNGGDAIINFLNASGTVQTVDVNGTITLTAASATADEGDAIFNSNTKQTVTATGSITLNGGGTGTTNSDARFVADDTQSVQTTTGNLSLLAGNGANADAFIRLTNTVVGADQTITVDAGNLIITADQDAAANNADAFIEMLVTDVTSDQTINVILGSITVTGGAGNNERAFISSEGNQNIDAETGITVQGYQAGATGNNSTAFISQNLATGAQSIDVNGTAANLTVLGGRGTNGVASITALGLTQDITVADGALFVRGNQTADATVNGSALVSADNVAAIQTIRVTNGGIVVEGGVDDSETATIQMTGTTGRQSIQLITDGDLLVEGGDGESSSALITSAGLDAAVGSEAQRIIIDAGQLIVRGNQDAGSDNSTATISQTNLGAASQIITINGLAGTDGTVTIEGGDGATEIAQILSNGTVAQTITIARGLTMQGGDGADSTALITSTGTGQAQTVTVTTGNALLTGGTADNTQARIEQTNSSGTQLIDILATSASSNLELLGGTGINADAAITSAGTVQTINVNNGLLRVRADQTGAGTDSDALIEASNITSQQTINVGIGTGTGYVVVVGGNSLDDDALISGANLQTITIAGRFIGNPFTAEGFTTGETDYIYQGGFGLGLKGGAGQNASGSITAGNTQLVTVNTGDVQMLGGSGQDAFVSIVETGLQNAAANQTVDVNDGKMFIQGGAGQDAFASIVLRNDNNNSGIQTINVDFLFAFSTPDTLALLGGSGLRAYASIDNEGTGNQAVTTSRQISLVGGDGDEAFAAIHQSGTGNQQLTITGAGDLKLTGGGGENSGAFVLADGNGATAHTQDITINNGDIFLQGNTDGTNNNSAAFIESTSEGTTQTINVLGTGKGNITLVGGTGDNEFAAITSGGIQTIGSAGTPINGVITMTGGNGAGNGSFAEIRAFHAQTIRVANAGNAAAAISVLGGSSTGNNDYALIVGGTDGTSSQIITTTQGDIVLSGNQGNSSAVVDGSSTEFGAGIIANGLVQTITINGTTGSNDLALTGGTIDDSAAVIELTNTGATTVQTIDVNLGSLTANGGTGTDAYALIRSRGTGIAGGNIAQVIEVENAVTLNGNAATSSVALGQYNLGAGIVSAGSQTLRTVNSVAGGNVALTAGTVQDSRAVVSMDSATGNQLVLVRKGNLTLDGGSSGAATGAEAIIDSNNTQEIGQLADRISGFVTLKGGSGNGANALVTAVNTQGVFIAGGAKDTTTFTNAALGLIGGSNTTEGGDATISQTNGTGTQTINILSGNAEILGGPGLNADARISAAGVSQTITVTDGALWVKADLADNTTANSDAIITATNAAAIQTLNVTNGGIIVQGGVGSTELATISMTGASGRQTINVLVDGDLLVEGGDGTGSAALITSAGINGGGTQAQRIIIDAGQLIVRGNQDAANGTGSATISQTSTAANTTQFIQVGGTTGTDGRITVLGGAGTSDSALISSTGRGTPAQQISAATDLTVQGGTGTTATAGITHAASILGAAANGQTITIGGNLLVQGGSGADAAALIQTNRNQSITVTGNASILADTDGANGGGSATINQTVFLNINQTIIVNGTTGLTITGGAGAGDSAGIDKVAITGGQTVAVANGSIVINGGSGLAVADNYGRIRSLSTGSQTINVADSGTIVLNGNQGSSADAVFGATLANYGAAILSAGNQTIGNLSGGAITLNGGNDTGAAALIGASGGTQTITARGAINVNAGSANQTSAQIRSLVQQQTITANGDINVTGNATAATDNFAIIRSGLGQSITTTLGGNLVITANNSSSSGAEGSTTGGLGAGLVSGGNQTLNIAGRIDVFAGLLDNAIIDQTTAALSAQTITAGGSINLTDGIGGDAVINAASTTVAGQQITATGSINLTANDGRLARISSGNNQLITTAATLNMTGDTTAASEARINAQTSRLNINGAAASNWNGTANYLATTQATINNNGAIVVNEQAGFTGGVTTPVLVFVTGQGTVGSTVGAPETANTRLNTFVDEIFFNAVDSKTVNISEDSDVDLRGTVGTVNLITMNTGDITTDTAALNATTAVFQTADGNIDLSGSTNQIDTFGGLIANNGFINYNGGGATTFANRIVSAEVLAGDGVFADGDITITTTGNSTFTTDFVRSTGGDVAMTANQIRFDATNGSTGGITGPIGGVGSVITEDGSQTYNSPVVLLTNTFMSAAGADDAIDFMSTINGPGGLEIGSTPSFNGNIGTNTPLAYLILNSPANSNFNAGGSTAVINGSFFNQGGGTLNIAGNWQIFVDNGVAGPGPGVFSGGNVNVTGSLAIYAPSPGSVTGTGIDTTENFLTWTGGVNGQPLVLVAGASGIFYKAPPPADEIKDKKNKRKDIEADYTVSYEEGVNAGTMVSVSGIPLAEPATAGSDKTRIGGLLTTSYGVNSPTAINTFYFGREVQAPIQLETDKLVNGPKGSPNRN